MLYLLACLICLTTSVAGGPGQTEYYNLVTNLFSGYKNDVRPTTSGEATQVFMNLLLNSLVDMDEQEQILKSYVTLSVEWNDDYLTWDPADYGNISTFLYPQKKLWVPDIINENSVESQTRLGYDQLVCRVDSDGTVRWQPSQVLETSCDIDITFYPFDTQTCDIVFTTVLSTKSEVDIDAFSGETSVILTYYSESAVWELLSATVTEPVESGSSLILFKLTLKRLRTYYIMNIILPILLLSLTASMVFYLPADSGEKVGLAITVLLSFAVYLTIISDETPKTSRQVSFLSVYLICLLAMTTLSVIVSIIVLSQHHKADEHPIGPRLIRWTRKIRNALGLNPFKTKVDKNKVAPTQEDISLTDLGFKNRSASPSEDQTDILIRDQLRLMKRAQKKRLEGALVEEPQEIEEHITWQKVAETLDRLLFFMFTFTIAALTLIILPYLAFAS